LPRGVTLFGGVSLDRTLQIACADPSNPNNLLYCDQTKSGIPWFVNLKLSASVPLRGGIVIGAALQSYKYAVNGNGAAIAGGDPAVGNVAANYGTYWLITPTTRYGANCAGPCTPGALVAPGLTSAQFLVPLVSPGTEMSDRINQLDVTVGKWFTIGKGVRVKPEFTVFNALNDLAAYAFRSLSYGTSSYFQPSTILPPRIARIGMQVKW
jgi:hypothetical protein